MADNQKKPPSFFLFEGLDGSGKSTQVNLLKNFLDSLGWPCQKLREPTNGQWGQKIQNILQQKEPSSKEKLLEYFILDRAEDVRQNIIPCLEQKKIIIMDRYYYSNAAYQGAMGFSPQLILKKNREQEFPEPDKIYYLDLDPKIALSRISVRNKQSQQKRDIFEKELFLGKVREIYLSLRNDRFITIDALRSEEDIFALIKKDLLNNFLKL